MMPTLALPDREPEHRDRAGIHYHVRGRRMTSSHDLEEVFRLRYRAYLDEQAIEPNEAGLLHDRYDELPNSYIMGLFFDGALHASIRVCVSTPEHPLIPATGVFGAYLHPMIERGLTVVDPNRLVVDSAFRRKLPNLVHAAVRLGFVACEHFDADIGISTPRPEHQAFYRRYMSLKPVSPAIMYPGLLKPVCLMAVDFPDVREKLPERFPLYRSERAERVALYGARSHD